MSANRRDKASARQHDNMLRTARKHDDMSVLCDVNVSVTACQHIYKIAAKLDPEPAPESLL